VVLKNKQDGVLDKDKTMDNVKNHNICNNSKGKIKDEMGRAYSTRGGEEQVLKPINSEYYTPLSEPFRSL
jgi:hypothetical protein